MNVRIKFLGGAKSVTGSKFLLEVDHLKILVDCGLFQGMKELRLRNWNTLPIDPKEIHHVIITHAHIDHTGYLPKLVKDGFNGQIHCTSATRDLMRIMLLDAAKLQEEEAQYAYKVGYSKHSRPAPLFTTGDAEAALHLIKHHPFDKVISLGNVRFSFSYAGHILGAASIQIDVKSNQSKKSIVFSGDVGRYSDPLMFEPKESIQADILLLESTYGDRVNPMIDIEEKLIHIIHDAIQRSGCILVPAFAVGRTQSLLHSLYHLIESKKIPPIPIYVDSPMAISVTDLYEKHGLLHRIKVEQIGSELISLFDSPYIHFCNSVESSKQLNDLSGPSIIISASGMCTGGRILHHLFHRLPRENDTLLFVGYQAEGTRGRDILEGKKSIRIFGNDIPVNCHVEEVHGLSAHADQEELMKWISNIKDSPKMTFLIHGEVKSSQTLANKIESEKKWSVIVPEYLESFELFTGI